MTNASRFDGFMINNISLDPRNAHLRSIRRCVGILIAGLILSGLTAFPIEVELHWLSKLLSSNALRSLAESTHLLPWIYTVEKAVEATNLDYPFLAYGTDWLAFAHLVIAAAFVGAYRDPVRNKWIFTWGLIACAGVFPMALIAGPLRELPLGWRLVDCSFGVCAAIPLLIAIRHIKALEGKAVRKMRKRVSNYAMQPRGLHGNAHDWLH
jgi:hypothetical protein